jgi:hypothetical protein
MERRNMEISSITRDEIVRRLMKIRCSSKWEKNKFRTHFLLTSPQHYIRYSMRNKYAYSPRKREVSSVQKKKKKKKKEKMGVACVEKRKKI